MSLPTTPVRACSAAEHRAALGSCRSCPVRHYCAVYAPARATPPANCPFGPGPTARRTNTA